MTRYHHSHLSGLGCLLSLVIALARLAAAILLVAAAMIWALVVLLAAGAVWLTGRRELAGRMAGSLGRGLPGLE